MDIRGGIPPLPPLAHLWSDSYLRAKTHESVKTAKNKLEYESFEYEFRLFWENETLEVYRLIRQ